MGDCTRFVACEPIGVDGSSFRTLNFSPQILSFVEMHKHMTFFPKDFATLETMKSLPAQEANEDEGRPAYVIGAGHARITEATVSAMVPMLSESKDKSNAFKKKRMLECCPLESFLESARLDWEAFCDQFDREGASVQRPPYPFTMETMREMLDEELAVQQ